MGDGAGNLRNPRATQKFPAVIDLEFDAGKPASVLIPEAEVAPQAGILGTSLFMR